MKLICAPMATLSHEAFRHIIEKFGGCDEYVTEMINASSLLNMGPFEKYYLMNGPCPEKIVWQITGNNAETMAKASVIAAQHGGIGVDINMGCSAPQIYKTGAGIAWMLKPLEETRALVHKVKEALTAYEKQESCAHIRLSVKCRLGAEDFSDSTFYSFTDMLVSEGVELITLHPRTIKEKYRRLPKYEYVQNLAERVNVPVILNGDIKDAKSAEYALSKAPSCAGLMIARMAAQKPWIFSEIRNYLSHENESMTTVDCQALALEFIDYVMQYQPPEFYKTRLQRFFAYYCQNFSFAHYFQTQMLNAKTVEESKGRIIDYFTKQPDDRFIKY
ncbi:MAG: tRNA-dihydrouridine synthase family protein [Treponema sp.]|nr:tRNA-dihydrouridine synthase family protein [Treponema sp.]